MGIGGVGEDDPRVAAVCFEPKMFASDDGDDGTLSVVVLCAEDTVLGDVDDLLKLKRRGMIFLDLLMPNVDCHAEGGKVGLCLLIEDSGVCFVDECLC